jgi:nucleoside-triphosphatase
MELFSQAFKAAVLAALEDPAPVIATVMARPHPWVDPLKRQPDVTLWQVTVENRDEMPSRVLEWVEFNPATNPAFF